jgi:hypothetical protein
MPEDLIARLEALGGFLTGQSQDDFMFEVLTPYSAPYKLVWYSANALRRDLEVWEPLGFQPRLAWLFREAAKAARKAEAR